MSRSTLRALPPGSSLSRVAALIAFCMLPQFPPPSGAQPLRGEGTTATTQLKISLVVRPVFKVLEVAPVKDGYIYRVWTNVRSIDIGGREYRFAGVGETTLKVDGRESDIDKQLNLDRSQGLAGNPRDLHTVSVTY